MTIDLSQETEARLREIAKSTGKSVGDVIALAIEHAYGSAGTKPRRTKMSPEEKAEMLRRIDEIRALPIEGPDDDFRVEDHDKIIYRVDW